MDCFKTDNQIITTLFPSEVKYLNLTNYHLLRGLDFFRFIKHAFIKIMVSQLVWFVETPPNQVKS